ncbi:MAG: DegT/DnrJ/EryC1/StrS family aminotransferase [Candidatus Acidiferrales bacterium]
MAKPATRLTVPQLDLKAQYAVLKEEIQAAIARVCERQQFILGPEGEALEQELADYCGAAHAVGCASGSDALLLSLVALGVERGDEVVTVPLTFFSTAGAVARLGARAAFVDIDPRSLTMDPARLEAYLKGLDAERRRRTRAIIAVHLYGQAAEMNALGEVAARVELPLIEDAAQALGGEYHGRRLGSLGRTGCFSFYPSKNLGAFGDAGLVTTSDDRIAERLRSLRHHGCTHDRYRHDAVGWNSRLDELQAAVLRVKLNYLEAWALTRQQVADRYDDLFLRAGLADRQKSYSDAKRPVVIPYRTPESRHAFHQYVVRALNRESLRQFLREEGVGTEVYYPVPLHRQECFRDWGGRAGQCPEAERAAEEVLALPMYPELTAEMQQYVVAKAAEFYRRPA